MARAGNNEHAMQIKLLTIGDSAVGKTCILLRYASDSFQTTFITTIGIDFKTKNVNIDGKPLRLQIWDTAGQERFRTITTSYFNGAQGILLVYDVTDRSTFNSIRNWIDQIQQHADENVNMLLIGNKVDLLRDERVMEDLQANGQTHVTTEEGRALASEYGVEFFETSAKENINVDAAFQAIAKATMERMLMQEQAHRDSAHRLEDTQRARREKKGCC